MSRAPSLKPQKLVKILKKDGFVKKRQAGSHLHLYHPEKKIRMSVPMHNKELKRGTLMSILQEAKIKLD